MSFVDRRRFIRQLSGAVLAARFADSGLATAADNPQESFIPLRRVAAQKNMLFGFALDPARLRDDATYRDVVAREASIVVPENALKWGAVHPEPDRYDFAPVDAIADFAHAHDQRMRGHTFCWHRALPDWVTRTVTPDNAQAVLTAHIAAVAGRYRGRIMSWDVVNEAIDPDDRQPGGLRNSFWYRMLGPRYLDIAFHAAHAADPGAVLGYNDYGLEADTPWCESRRALVLEMLRGLVARGVPVHALGMQSHLRAGAANAFGDGLVRFIADVRRLGIEVYVTELDVDDSRLTGSDDERDAAVAWTYKRYLECVLSTRAIAAVLTWGVWDNPHRTGATPTDGPVAQRPLAFAQGGALKPATWVLEHGFEQAQPYAGRPA